MINKFGQNVDLGQPGQPAPAGQPTAPGGNPLLQMMMQMFGGGQQQQQQGSPLDFAALATNLGRSPLEQQHDSWVGAQGPSYLGNANNPFNNGFFGAKPGSQEFSGRTGAADNSIPLPQTPGASPAPFMPAPGGLPFPVPGLPQNPNPQQIDQGLAQNQSMYQPGGFASLLAPTPKKKKAAPASSGSSARRPGTFSFGASAF